MRLANWVAVPWGTSTSMGGGGLEGRGSTWDLISQGGGDGTGPILVRELRCATKFGGGLRDGPVGLLGDRPWGALAAGAGSLDEAGVAPLQG